jgi:hypothetical protein
MTQSRIDSFMEAVTNTAIGFVVSLITWAIVAYALSIPMTWGKNLEITGIFTVVSVARSYLLRRAFNGRSVWLTIKHSLTN